MQLSQKSIDEFKTVFKKDYGKDLTDEEASEGANNLVGLMDLLFQMYIKDQKRQKKLKEFPKGFPIDDDGVYSCLVCCASITTANGWYDEYGQKCLDCQRAVDTGILPPAVFKDRDSWISMWHLESEFKLHSATIRKLVRAGKLKARIVTNENGKPYYYVFLINENRNFLKKLIKEHKK